MIRLEAVCKSFETHTGLVQVLSQIDLHVNKGECVLLKGESGSGKSTLLSLIASVQRPTSGAIWVQDMPIAKLPEAHAARFRREMIGFIFQHYYLIPFLSVEENVGMPLVPLNLSTKAFKAQTHLLMERFNILHKADVAIEKLSGGEQQRTAIARALVANPRIVLADEPTAHLDAMLSRELIAQLNALKAQGVTQVIATHDSVIEKELLYDRIVHLKQGALVL